MRLLGKTTSINVRKVLWTCAVIGLPVTPEPWGSGTAHSCDEPEFLRLNPNGMVPVLIEDGMALWESNTICRYLAARHGRGDLLPAGPMQRAQVEKWMDWQAAELNPAWRHAFMGLVRKHPDFADPARIEASATQWNRLMGLIDRQLDATGAYLAGHEFTLADIVVGLSTNRWLCTPIGRPELPAVAAWYKRLSAQPGFAQHCANGVA
ncbi:MAG: glutathione S-transferase family protein [Gammaproteobacteria bacterium]